MLSSDHPHPKICEVIKVKVNVFLQEPASTTGHQELLTAIQTELRLVVNKKDSEGNTALHYATQQQDQVNVKALLSLGANIWVVNDKKVIPVDRILPGILEAFLDTR